MAYNSSRLPETWCLFLFFPNATSKSSPVYYQVTIVSCVMTSLLAPMAVVENALIMAAIWKNPSLRTPSYVLLASLAFTGFCTGLLSQPFLVMYRLGELPENKKMICITGVITQGVGYYFSSLTVIVMTIMAVERWLHMSRRSLLTVRRVLIICNIFVMLLILLFAYHMYSWYDANKFSIAFIVIFVSGAALCFLLTVLAYFKVFQLTRLHQSQVQTNQNAIDIQKYRKSVFTILYILGIFLLSYVPYVCCILVASITEGGFRSESLVAAMILCAVIVFSSSFLNPLLCYWRIKEIRESVRGIIRILSCKETLEDS